MKLSTKSVLCMVALCLIGVAIGLAIANKIVDALIFAAIVIVVGFFAYTTEED